MLPARPAAEPGLGVHEFSGVEGSIIDFVLIRFAPPELLVDATGGVDSLDVGARPPAELGLAKGEFCGVETLLADTLAVMIGGLTGPVEVGDALFTGKEARSTLALRIPLFEPGEALVFGVDCCLKAPG